MHMLTDVRVSEQRCDQVMACAQTVQVEEVGQHCLARMMLQIMQVDKQQQQQQLVFSLDVQASNKGQLH